MARREIKTIERMARQSDLVQGNVTRPPSEADQLEALKAKGWISKQTVHSAAGANVASYPWGDPMISVEAVRPKPVRRDPWRRPIRDFEDRKVQLLKDIREGR